MLSGARRVKEIPDRLDIEDYRPDQGNSDLTLLQHLEGDASAGAAAAPEPGSGCARLLAGLSFNPPHSPLRAPHPRAQRKISVNRGVYRVAPTNMLYQMRKLCCNHQFL